MNDIMLPWPGPRRRADDGSPRAPHYEIQQVFGDGSSGPLEVVPITRPPWSAKAGRRGFLGAGIASSVVLSLLLTGCNHDDGSTGSGSTGTGTGSTGTGSTGTGSTGPTGTGNPTPTPNQGGGGGGTICTCNKVCTCIPVG